MAKLPETASPTKVDQAPSESAKAPWTEVLATASGAVTGAGQRAAQTGKAVIQTSLGIAAAIARSTSQSTDFAFKLAVNTSKNLFKTSHYLATQATRGTGQAITYVSDNPLIRKLTRAMKLEWLTGLSDQVDLQKAAEAVQTLQQKHPEATPSQIAHQIMLEKAIYAGGVGLASSLVPGGAIALLAVDLATTTALQTEMLYQIAAAYGLDLNDPARKGEVLAIFGLTLGGNRAIKAGLATLKTVPLAGALIGASANATLLYTLGYAACRFYEAKLNPEVVETSTETLEAIKQKSETYLEVAIAQQALVDQILAHMILATYPETSWNDILPQLDALQLSPNSLETIAENLKAPQPLGALLDQLNQDFAVLTLARCYAIAHLDGVITEAESELLQTMSRQFDLDLSAIKTVVSSTAN